MALQARVVTVPARADGVTFSTAKEVTFTPKVVWDLSNFPSLSNLQLGGSAVSIDLRDYMSGADALTATLTIVPSVGDDPATKGWSISGGDNLANALGGTAGSGTFYVEALASDSRTYRSPLLPAWQIFSPAPPDALAPTKPIWIGSANPKAGQVDLTLLCPTDTKNSTNDANDVDEVRILRNGSLLTTLVPPSANFVGQFAAYTVGSLSVAATVTQTGADWEFVGSGGNGIGPNPDGFEGRFVLVNGDFKIACKVPAWTGPKSFSKAALMARSSTADDATFVMAVKFQGTSGYNLEWRPTPGVLPSKLTAVAQTGDLWMRLEREGDVFSMYVSTDGVHWTLHGSTTLALGAALYVGMASGSQETTGTPVGQTVNFETVTLTQKADLTYSDTTTQGGTQYTYTAQSVDVANNNSGNGESLVITTVSIVDPTPPTTPGTPSVAAASSTQLNLSWTASTHSQGLDPYEVWGRLTGSGDPFAFIATAATNSYSHTGLTAEQGWDYQIRAISSEGVQSAFSSTGSGVTDPEPPAPDSTPDPFTFNDVTGAPLNTQHTSNTITITGINVQINISVSAGGSYSKNGGTYTTAAGTAVNGDTITLRRTSSANNSTNTDTVFTAGGVSDTWRITTVAAGGSDPGGTVRMVEGFEVAFDSAQGGEGVITNNFRTSLDGGRIQTQTAIRYSGTRAIRADLTYNASNFRAEISEIGSQAIRGQTWVYKHRLYLPAPYVSDSLQELVTQWHYQNPYGWLGISIRSGSLRFTAQTHYDPIGSAVGSTVLGTTASVVNTWVTFVTEIALSQAANGRIRLWMNGVQKINKTNLITVPALSDPGKGADAYMKAGIYKAEWGAGANPRMDVATSRTLYVDLVEMRRGADPVVWAQTP